jgi:hypothetical protein
VLFSSQLHLTRHGLAPRVYASLDDAQVIVRVRVRVRIRVRVKARARVRVRVRVRVRAMVSVCGTARR